MARAQREPESGATEPAAAYWRWADQVAVAAEAASAVWSGLRAMRSIHEEALRDALRRQADATRKLGAAPTADDWMAWQAELLRDEFEAATRYWQQVAGAALEMNSELLGCGAHLVDTEDAFAPFSPRFLHS